MTQDQLKAFLSKVKGDSSLQEKLKTAADTDSVADIARDAGFSVSADLIPQPTSKLSEEDLESISGGGYWGNSIHPYCQGDGGY